MCAIRCSQLRETSMGAYACTVGIRQISWLANTLLRWAYILLFFTWLYLKQQNRTGKNKYICLHIRHLKFSIVCINPTLTRLGLVVLLQYLQLKFINCGPIFKFFQFHRIKWNRTVPLYPQWPALEMLPPILFSKNFIQKLKVRNIVFFFAKKYIDVYFGQIL